MLVYLITNRVNGKKYIGQTSQLLMKRWSRHKKPFSHRRNSYLYNAICKYGAGSFSVEPLVIVGSKSEMDYYERELIKVLDLRNPEKGYNLTDGGGGMLGFKLSDDTKKRMSEHVKSEEHCKNISIAKQGNKSRLGLKHSEETKKRMSEVARGRKFSSEHRHNLCIARRKYLLERQSDGNSVSNPNSSDCRGPNQVPARPEDNQGEH